MFCQTLCLRCLPCGAAGEASFSFIAASRVFVSVGKFKQRSHEGICFVLECFVFLLMSLSEPYTSADIQLRSTGLEEVYEQ